MGKRHYIKTTETRYTVNDVNTYNNDGTPVIDHDTDNYVETSFEDVGILEH